MIDQDDFLQAWEHVKEKFLQRHAFSSHHEKLLLICFGILRPNPSKIQALPDAGLVTADHLRMMHHMALVDFAASVEKAQWTQDEIDRGEPNVFDVFVINASTVIPYDHLAVVLPVRGADPMWFNGGYNLVAINDPDTPMKPKWKIANLAGPARVLEALTGPCGDLTYAAWDCSLLAMPPRNHGRLFDVSPVRYGPDVSKLNDSQREAVATMLDPAFKQGFFVVQGPPGCGKTTTIVEMISAVGAGVLVVAPSNAAVANIASKLFESGRYAIEELVVFGRNPDPSVHFLSPLFRGLKLQKFITAYEDDESEEKRAKLVHGLQEWLHIEADPEKPLKESYLELCRTCPYIDLNVQSGRLKLKQKLGQSKVVLSTLNSAGSAILQNSARVHTAFFDEAGQASEAEFYILAQFPGIERITIVGDPKQLPATVIDQTCKDAGFGRSWMERVMNTNADQIHLLDVQYRMDPKILSFPNHAFYDNRVKSGENVSAREISIRNPFQCIDTLGRGHEERDEFSWINAFEVEVVRVLVHTDEDIKRLLSCSDGQVPIRIIVITPYRAQAKLLRQKIKTVPGNAQVDIATVDSFQGQEGEVVIFSPVRTRKVGFVDDNNRINVAITRAKRVLRVVGEASFFLEQPANSILRRLFGYAKKNGVLVDTIVRGLAYGRPDWQQDKVWEPSLNARFHACFRNMSDKDKNVSLNTLLGICRRDVNEFTSRISQNRVPAWNSSWHKAHSDKIRIVWIAKKGCPKPVIEAHFAGTPRQCREFMSRVSVPSHACHVNPNLAGLRQDIAASATKGECILECPASWPLTNCVQQALFAGTTLPEGGVHLDAKQEEIAQSEPPLLIESRSGTGKTLVLLQHAAFHSDRRDQRAACFVTVSARLRRQLEKKYDELNQIDNFTLPPMLFFSFVDFLSQLLKIRGVSDFDGLDCCRFIGFIEDRKTHQRFPLDPCLVENEIGGVITGSREAALQTSSLSRSQYLTSVRSNISSKSEGGRRMREIVYEQFEQYEQWKRTNNMFDINDQVLRLLRLEWNCMFSAAYLDEIQDLSYAAIFLLCKIAGKDSMKWVCAGDPAQMISPGCSFTFDGLKQTLLSLQPGIEGRLSQVSHLSVNYRTTKDILLLGNEILAVAKKAFPGAIGFAAPEVSTKDLGFKVILCPWGLALEQKVKLGRNQAFIFSSDDGGKASAQAEQWLGQHPFTLSSLDSKGLEFDDVIVAFDIDRKAWKVESKSEIALRMLREIYVAITRAKRRVVILLKKDCDTMSSFFSSLQYNFQTIGADLVLQEFDTATTPAEWEEKGQELFEDKRYIDAARCFEKSGNAGWMNLAEGRDFQQRGKKDAAKMAFRKSIMSFYERRNFLDALKVAHILARSFSWDKDDDDVIEKCMESQAVLLDRFFLVSLELHRGEWKRILVDDLKDKKTAHLFEPHRKNPAFRCMIRNASEDDRKDIRDLLPLHVGDYYYDRCSFKDAVVMYLEGGEFESAEKATLSCLDKRGNRAEGVEEVEDIVRAWTKTSRALFSDKLMLLLRLFESPEEIGREKGGHCFQTFGRFVVLRAVDSAHADRTVLYSFDRKEFTTEIDMALEARFGVDRLGSVRWYMARNDISGAEDFVKKRLKLWSNDEKCAACLIIGEPSVTLRRELALQKLQEACILAALPIVAMSMETKKRLVLSFENDKLSKAATLLLKVVVEAAKHKKVAADGDAIPVPSTADGDAALVPSTASARMHHQISVLVEQSLQQLRVHCQKAVILDVLKAIPGAIAAAMIVSKDTAQFPSEYGPFFNFSVRYEISGFFQRLGGNERLWMLKAFNAYNASFQAKMPKKFALEFAIWSLEAGLRDRSLSLSWDAMSNRSMARTNWPAVAKVWIESSFEDRCWLLNQSPEGFAFLFGGNPRLSAQLGEEQNGVLRCVGFYGMPIAKFLVMAQGTIDKFPSLLDLQACLEHSEELAKELTRRRNFAEAKRATPQMVRSFSKAESAAIPKNGSAMAQEIMGAASSDAPVLGAQSGESRNFSKDHKETLPKQPGMGAETVRSKHNAAVTKQSGPETRHVEKAEKKAEKEEQQEKGAEIRIA